MSDESPQPNSPPRPPAGAAAEVFDQVAWDFDPEADFVSPLVTTERYFRDFPWLPEED